MSMEYKHFETMLSCMIWDNILYGEEWNQAFRDRWVEEILLNLKHQFPRLFK